MIAYLILSHGDTGTLRETILTIYHPDNLYCVCSTRVAANEMLSGLDSLRSLGNVHLVLVPPTSWGTVLEAYLRGIDFCLNFSDAWSSLIVISGTDVGLVPQETVFDMLKGEHRDSIVLDICPQPVELHADADIIDRLLRDPFGENLSKRDNAVYNPFPFVRANYAREGSTFFAEGDFMRAGWTGDSHFVTALVQNRRDANSDVYSEKISPFLRRALDLFFKEHSYAASSIYGIFPRDFCTFATSAPLALGLYSIVRNSFASEEFYFATLASSDDFRDRISTRNITFRIPTMDRRLTVEDIISAFSPRVDTAHGELDPGPYLFARKAPSDNLAGDFYNSIRHLFGIRLHDDLALYEQHQNIASVDLVDYLFRIVDVTMAPFNAGVLGDPRVSRERFMLGGSIEHESNGTHAIGNTWSICDYGLATMERADIEFARFESFRVKNGKFLLFGYWGHHPMATLCLESKLVDVVQAQEPSDERETDSLTRLLSEWEWEFWLNEEKLDVVKFQFGLFASISDERGFGVWRLIEGKLVAVGLGSMPIAVFSVDLARSVDSLSGICWGRQSAKEPCVLRRFGNHGSASGVHA